MNETLLSHQAGLAVGAVYLIELLKRSAMPWFSRHSDELNRITSVLLALCTAIGLSMNLKGSLVLGGTLTITFPSLNDMLATGVHFLAQVGMQQGFYQAAIKSGSSSAPS